MSDPKNNHVKSLIDAWLAGYPDPDTMQADLEKEAAALAAGYPNLISMQMEQAQADTVPAKGKGEAS